MPAEAPLQAVEIMLGAFLVAATMLGIVLTLATLLSYLVLRDHTSEQSVVVFEPRTELEPRESTNERVTTAIAG